MNRRRSDVTSRCVVACRLPRALVFGDTPLDALARFGSLAQRASVLGGELVASSYDGIVFAWEEGGIKDAVSLATAAAHSPVGDEPVWACGIACGELHQGKAPLPGATRPLEWGEPLAVASALARIARPREVLVSITVPAVVSRELLTDRARVGMVGGRRIRGFRVDARKPWRAVAANDIARMVDPPLLGRDAEVLRLMEATGVITLRVDSGFGGSRMLQEVALRTRPSRSITLTPFSVIHEPLGTLRRAMAFVAATERITLPASLHPVLDRLLLAQGITLEEAGQLIVHQLRAAPGEPVPSLLLDDATDIDEPSIEACSRAIHELAGGVRVVTRIDSMSQLPRGLARYSDGREVAVGRLEADTAQAVAGACTGEALETKARAQWARRGGGTPLAIIEAVAAGLAKGELVWADDVLSPLKRTGGEDIARPVGYWIARRAEDLKETSRDVLIALAHLGGEASASELFDVVNVVAPEVDLTAELVTLRRGRWIREARPGSFVLMTRAQREAILEFSRNERARDWRSAVAQVLEQADGTLRRAEASQHAARAGMGEWASRLAMTAARTAAQAGLEESASTLAAFAGVQDPMSDDLDLGALPLEDEGEELEELLAVDDEPSPKAESMPPPAMRVPPVGPPPVPKRAPPPRPPVPARPSPPPPPPRPGRLSEERIAKALSFEGLLDAARDLRETEWAELARRSLVHGADEGMQRRGLLALARAYAAEGRSSEALIHGLDALARMREDKDRDGTRTCLLFLARIYEQTDRQVDAVTLKNAAKATLDAH